MHYIASGAGVDNPMGSISRNKMRLLLLPSFAVSFRKTALNSWFYIDFSRFQTCGAGADNYGVNFEHQKNLLSLITCCKFQKDCFEH